MDTCVHRAKDLGKNLFSSCERTLNQQKPSNTRILPPVTVQVFGKVLTKAKHYDSVLRTSSSKATFEENFTQSKRRLRDRGYPDNLTKILQNLNLAKECPPYRINKKWPTEIYRL